MRPLSSPMLNSKKVKCSQIYVAIWLVERTVLSTYADRSSVVKGISRRFDKP